MKAGVSQPTVSLVLGDNPTARVSAATRERVLEAAEALGYRPNVLARGLKQRRSYALGVIVPDLANPFYVMAVSGIERVAAERGYAVLLCDAREVNAAEHLAALRSRLIDGVIVSGRWASELPESAVGDLNLVLIDEASERWPAVVSDAAAAGRLAAEHLLGLGHETLGFIGPAYDLYRFRMRERGFVQALRARGVTLASEHLRRAPPTAVGGEDAMRGLLAAARRPTAVFCANDLMAAGALKACSAAGVPVPEVLSLIGCDDLELARLVTPSLTTIAVPARELGARAARLLLSRIEPDERAPGTRPLPVKLVERDTTARARGRHA